MLVVLTTGWPVWCEEGGEGGEGMSVGHGRARSTEQAGAHGCYKWTGSRLRVFPSGLGVRGAAAVRLGRWRRLQDVQASAVVDVTACVCVRFYGIHLMPLAPRVFLFAIKSCGQIALRLQVGSKGWPPIIRMQRQGIPSPNRAFGSLHGLVGFLLPIMIKQEARKRSAKLDGQGR